MLQQIRSQHTRTAILDATHRIIIRDGATKITVSAITTEADITRSLFYHYFAGKDEVIEALLDYIIDDFLTELDAWNNAREPGNIEKSLEEATTLMRKILNEDGPFATSLARNSNAQLYLIFTDRAASRIARYITETTVRDYKEHHPVKITHIESMIYMLLTGLTALIRSDPSISDETITLIIAQTLHLQDHLAD
ncbi:TetR/AcrR family transcriptional regulator [Arcanobacterium buesumense]|uniref:TetR/AcrR family transcriptional regulator n=1 Tax=Arcanobacterium buesumense TaxID=2722751 RepID=A0A6H2EM09_9ACTO|nr:TetR/AcrR family transcriptional regulator [Arcanobacterium buesumense]QJC22110.1 TetR/AcrR family transcriptional regulator [Arcanobacterium buesumense]